MSHGDQVTKIPDGFETVASTPTAPFAAVERESDQIYGIQFHPEVTHTPEGKQLLKNFVCGICKAKSSWTMVFEY
jgi:GMP synthase (glutamine-hydrolysing)